MPRYCVTFPIAGSLTVEVEADSEEAAIDAAWEVETDPAEADLTWERYTKIVSGNVFHAEQNEIDVEKIED